LKDRGFESNFPELILTCGEGRYEGEKGVENAYGTRKFSAFGGTLVTVSIAIYIYF
jgi:hypothetical protein